jgi:hypothetical protein
VPVFVSPHYYFPHDHRWEFGGTLEQKMHRSACPTGPAPSTRRASPAPAPTGASSTSPASPTARPSSAALHKVYGPEQNDLVLQLRKRGINKVVLAGMSANLCVESHLRELLEQGFEVAVVADATAAARHPEMGEGYAVALTNFRDIAGAVLTTEETGHGAGRLDRASAMTVPLRRVQPWSHPREALRQLLTGATVPTCVPAGAGGRHGAQPGEPG